MKKNILKLVSYTLLAAAITLVPVLAFSQEQTDENAATESGDAAKPKRDTIPFHGKVAAIDKEAMTFTIGERTFHVTADTKMMKSGEPVTLDDIVVGEDVGGVCKKSDDGKLMAVSVRFGAKPEKKQKKEKTDSEDETTE